MADLISPGDGLLFMKVGTHADESLESIIDRKRREIETAGFALWGYGGNTCHPNTMVQPFARDFESHGATIRLCMQPMESNHFAVTERAVEFSEDGVNWQEIPPTIDVLGSRYALAIRDLQTQELSLDLAGTRVAVGRSKGRPGDQYIAGRVDKACLEVVEPLDPGAGKEVEIGLVAELVEPYAVFVRN